MNRRIIVADPDFGQRLKAFRTDRGIGMRDLGVLVNYSRTMIYELEHGKTTPTPELALALDRALEAGGQLAALVTTRSPIAPLNPDEADRLALVRRQPRSVDSATVESLATILDGQRRLEDAIGSGPLLASVTAQLALVERLVSEARGPIRQPVVALGAQWAQFCGWLHANRRADDLGRRWYSRALEWATEAADTNMVATALSMTGHLAYLAGQPGPMIGLSQAAGRQQASPGVRALAAQQEARGHAIVGDAADAVRMLDEAVTQAAQSAEHPDSDPPWIYFHGTGYLMMQRGLVYRYLGRHEDALDLLRAGLAAVGPEIRRSEWGGVYLYQVAVTLLALGDRAGARAELVDIDTIASATGSTRLEHLVTDLRQAVGAVT